MVNTLDSGRAVRVRALTRVIVLRSEARHFTFTVPLSIQEYKWIPVNCEGNMTKILVAAVTILLVVFVLRNLR